MILDIILGSVLAAPRFRKNCTTVDNTVSWAAYFLGPIARRLGSSGAVLAICDLTLLYPAHISLFCRHRNDLRVLELAESAWGLWSQMVQEYCWRLLLELSSFIEKVP